MMRIWRPVGTHDVEDINITVSNKLKALAEKLCQAFVWDLESKLKFVRLFQDMSVVGSPSVGPIESKK